MYNVNKVGSTLLFSPGCRFYPVTDWKIVEEKVRSGVLSFMETDWGGGGFDISSLADVLVGDRQTLLVIVLISGLSLRSEPSVDTPPMFLLHLCYLAGEPINDWMPHRVFGFAVPVAVHMHTYKSCHYIIFIYLISAVAKMHAAPLWATGGAAEPPWLGSNPPLRPRAKCK